RAATLDAAPSVHDVAALRDGRAHDGAARGEAAVGPGAAVGEQAAGEGGAGHALRSPTRVLPASCASGDVVPPKDDPPPLWPACGRSPRAPRPPPTPPPAPSPPTAPAPSACSSQICTASSTPN